MVRSSFQLSAQPSTTATPIQPQGTTRVNSPETAVKQRLPSTYVLDAMLVIADMGAPGVDLAGQRGVRPRCPLITRRDLQGHGRQGRMFRIGPGEREMSRGAVGVTSRTH